MHILIIPSWYINSYSEISGIFFKEQAEALAKHNNKVGVLSIQNINIRTILNAKRVSFVNKQYEENSIYTYCIEYPSIPKFDTLNRYIKLKIFKKIFKRYIIQNGMPDIVHLHSFMDGQLAIWLKKNYNIPFVTTEHFSGFARKNISKNNLNFTRTVFEHSAYNIAVSQEFKSLLEGKYNLEFNYIPNIVNVDFFNPKDKLDDEQYKFINIASLDKNKNQEMLINAFYTSFYATNNVQLTIVGYGPEYNNLKKLIKKLKLENQVSLYGKASREEVKDLLQKSDAFVLSSKYETFGVVIIEAMACGLPVVATKCGGSESIVANDKLGLLSEINKSNLSDKLKILYDNREEYDKDYIRKYAIDNFSELSVANKLIKIYKKVLK